MLDELERRDDEDSLVDFGKLIIPALRVYVNYSSIVDEDQTQKEISRLSQANLSRTLPRLDGSHHNKSWSNLKPRFPRGKQKAVQEEADTYRPMSWDGL